MTHEKQGSKMYKKLITEEHVTLVQEPGSHYIGHITPISGSARNIAATMMDFFSERDIDLKDIIAIGCDGTAVNTGSKGGIIRVLEENIQRPLQWVVCLLHCNELPLRHLIEELDGETTGPVGFKGPIGKQLNDCEKLPVTEYKKIPSENINTDIRDLSTDQHYMLDIYKAVSSGECDDSVAMRSPGKIAHSRWLTTANRIMRLFVATSDPSDNLIRITTYIMKVYVPMWYDIKRNHSIENGAKHVHQMITRSRSLDASTRQVTDQVIQRNAFFAHPENILVSMLSDERKFIRQLGYRRILNVLKKDISNSIRTFKVPKLNFEAEQYIDMINWQETTVTVPPLLHGIRVSTVEELIITGNKTEMIPKIPCHTQAVERLIKLVTDSSSAVSGPAARDGFIRMRINSTKKMPKFETKKQFTM